jgi:CDGSH-type Zn-finger protein
MSSEKPKITPTPNGPYLVKGLESIGNAKGKLEARATMALCRCGKSNNKPFCDGTHSKIGFNSDKLAGRVPDQRDTYEGSAITVHDNRGQCAHAGYCTDGLPSAFRMKEEPFVDADGADAKAIAATINKCPSGALRYALNGVDQADRGGDPNIFVAPNGPYVVSGGCELQADFGTGLTNDHFTLCRCGGSKNKPFCDGTHWNGFKAE